MAIVSNLHCLHNLLFSSRNIIQWPEQPRFYASLIPNLQPLYLPSTKGTFLAKFKQGKNEFYESLNHQIIEEHGNIKGIKSVIHAHLLILMKSFL